MTRAIPEILDSSPADIKNQMAIVLEEAGFTPDDIYESLGVNLIGLNRFKAMKKEILEPFLRNIRAYVSSIAVVKVAKILEGLKDEKILKMSQGGQVKLAQILADVGAKMEEKGGNVDTYVALLMRFSKKE